MPGLGERQLQPEIMDQPGLDPAEHDRALDALAHINFLSFTANSLFRPLARFQRETKTRPLRILDVACGGGDVASRLSTMSLGLDWHISGCDLSQGAIEHARRRLSKAAFFQLNAVTQPIPREYDAIYCSLFLHHLSSDQACAMLRSFAASGARLILVSDLDRSRIGFWLARVLTRLITRSPVVHYDGPVSVRAAFRPFEALELARQAGLDGAKVSRNWPFRWLLTWRRP